VLIPFALTHSTLARLVGARRPSVTSAIGELAKDGLLERTDDGWLLRGDPSQLVTPLLERLAATA
jgi:CRP/FNR family transcriptional regulator, cyclic AMP receptor protein